LTRRKLRHDHLDHASKTMTSYAVLKWVHVGCVVASGQGFLVRGLLMMAGSALLAHRVVRVAPHVVDTALLASAVALAVIAQLSPLAQPWLGAKIIGLLAYIVLGSVALRRGRTRGVRTAAFAAALVVYAWIITTALTRDPLAVFRWAV
jgi:uncharacterized membrane protein SirB2